MCVCVCVCVFTWRTLNIDFRCVQDGTAEQRDRGYSAGRWVARLRPTMEPRFAHGLWNLSLPSPTLLAFRIRLSSFQHYSALKFTPLLCSFSKIVPSLPYSCLFFSASLSSLSTILGERAAKGRQRIDR
ncbi:hypothetical protein E2C01_092680 [Portunus trituberculatus]|uniref:Uncharacterized protein n=1 Tax=Portunus trituberculatus TaxID=210409 RepID=A0A5B7JWI8_PORTR|nr:hypothetical protein [Portunus trituberculatus]